MANPADAGPSGAEPAGAEPRRRRRRALTETGVIILVAYGLDTLRCDLDRFAFLLGGNDGEHLFGEDQALPR